MEYGVDSMVVCQSIASFSHATLYKFLDEFQQIHGNYILKLIMCINNVGNLIVNVFENFLEDKPLVVYLNEWAKKLVDCVRVIDDTMDEHDASPF